MLSLILSGVTDFTRRGVRAWHDCSSGPGRATPATPVNIYQARCLALHCEFSSIRCGIVCMILFLAILVEHRLVTDTDTDRHRAIAYTALA